MGTEKVQKSSKLVSMTVNGEKVERTIDATKDASAKMSTLGRS